MARIGGGGGPYNSMLLVVNYFIHTRFTQKCNFHSLPSYTPIRPVTHSACSLASSCWCLLCCSSVTPRRSTCSLSPRSTSPNSAASSGLDSTSLPIPYRKQWNLEIFMQFILNAHHNIQISTSQHFLHKNLSFCTQNKKLQFTALSLS